MSIQRKNGTNIEVQDLLFEYVKDTLYRPKKAELNVESLPPEFQNLGAGLVQLKAWLDEGRIFAKELSKGNIDVSAPDGNNVIAAELKALQASLLHLTWQTAQIAKGDYSQKVDFMGAFSTAFNTLTAQLEIQRENLIQDKKILENNNLRLLRVNEVFTSLADNSGQSIIVVDINSGEWLYRNTSATFLRNHFDEGFFNCLFAACPCSKDEQNVNGEFEYKDPDGGQCYFETHSFYFHWGDVPAIAHSIVDITKRKQSEGHMRNLAYTDELTRLYNRAYGMDRLNKLSREKKNAVIIFCDIDLLKKCNDELGHAAGDQYIISVSETLLKIPEKKTVCRIGGDEFLVIKEESSIAEMEKVMTSLRNQYIHGVMEDVRHPRSFSFGVSEINEKTSVSDALSEADIKMYQDKIRNKFIRII